MKLVHVFFCFSEESLNGEFFFFRFFGSVHTEGLNFFLPPSRPSHLGNSAEFTEFYRFILSSTRFNACLISGVSIDAVRAESVTNRLSHTALGRFFERWVSNFIMDGANLTFVNLEEADFYGMELKGQKPVHVSYFIDGVGDEGVVLVTPK